MRLIIQHTNTFKDDLKKIARQGKKLEHLDTVIAALSSGERLDKRYKDHKLKGNWAGHRECHIKPDWLLIYYTTGNHLVLVRTGSHSELLNL